MKKEDLFLHKKTLRRYGVSLFRSDASTSKHHGNKMREQTDTHFILDDDVNAMMMMMMQASRPSVKMHSLSFMPIISFFVPLL
jgi:hypothetical protein